MDQDVQGSNWWIFLEDLSCAINVNTTCAWYQRDTYIVFLDKIRKRRSLRSCHAITASKRNSDHEMRNR